MSSHITKELINLLEKQVGGDSTTEVPNIISPYDVVSIPTNKSYIGSFFTIIFIMILIALSVLAYIYRDNMRNYLENTFSKDEQE